MQQRNCSICVSWWLNVSAIGNGYCLPGQILRRVFFSPSEGRICLCLSKPVHPYPNMIPWRNGSNELGQGKVITPTQGWSSLIFLDESSETEQNLKKRKKRNRRKTENRRKRCAGIHLPINLKQDNKIFWPLTLLNQEKYKPGGPMQGVQVWSLVRKLSSHVPCGQKTKT